jgi:hypothetical protein
MHSEIVHRHVSGVESVDGIVINELAIPPHDHAIDMKQLWAHTNSLFSLAFPLIANALITEAQYVITMSYIGRIGTEELGAYVLGNML